MYKVVQIWPGLIFFLNHNCQTFTCTCVSSTYSPPESTHFFQSSGSILMPFSKKACGWRRIHSRTVWMTASSSDDHAVHSPCPLWSTYTTQTHGSVRDTLPHTVVEVCREFQRTGRRHPDCSGVNTPPTTSLFFEKGIRMLPERWKKCVGPGGEYVEAWHVQVSVWQLWFKKKNQSRPYLNYLVQVYRPLPPSGNPIAVNKYRIISNSGSCKVFLLFWSVTLMNKHTN